VRNFAILSSGRTIPSGREFFSTIFKVESTEWQMAGTVHTPCFRSATHYFYYMCVFIIAEQNGRLQLPQIVRCFDSCDVLSAAKKLSIDL
jgi:hypothetical protein